MQVYHRVDEKCLVAISEWQDNFSGSEDVLPMAAFRDLKFMLPPTSRQSTSECLGARAQVAYVSRVLQEIQKKSAPKDSKDVGYTLAKAAYKSFSDAQRNQWRTLSVQLDLQLTQVHATPNQEKHMIQQFACGLCDFEFGNPITSWRSWKKVLDAEGQKTLDEARRKRQEDLAASREKMALLLSSQGQLLICYMLLHVVSSVLKMFFI